MFCKRWKELEVSLMRLRLVGNLLAFPVTFQFSAVAPLGPCYLRLVDFPHH
jgi:hypothetical protein